MRQAVSNKNRKRNLPDDVCVRKYYTAICLPVILR